MSEFSTIIIKTSTTSQTPPASGQSGALAVGELAYSFVSGKLFIGVAVSTTYPTGYRVVNDTAELSQAQLDAVAALIASAIAAEATTTAANLATEVSILVTQMGLNAQAASDALAAAIMQEVTARDAAIAAAIVAEEMNRDAAISNAIATEVTARDAAIDAAIDAENIQQIRDDVAQKVEQSDIDSAINQEVSDRNDAIDTLRDEFVGQGGVIDTAIDAALAAGKDANFNNLTVQNLVVNGTTTTVNSEQTSIKDPVIELGVNPNPAGDNFNRGVKYHYANGGPKTGFFGVSSTERDVFEFIPETTGVDTLTGAKGKVRADLLGNADTATTANSLATPRNILFDNEVLGGFSFNGASDLTVGLSVNATADSTVNSIVRRDNMGAVKFTAVETSTLSNMYGGINGKSQNGAASALTGFVIHGGTF